MYVVYDDMRLVDLDLDVIQKKEQIAVNFNCLMCIVGSLSIPVVVSLEFWPRVFLGKIWLRPF